MTDDKQIIKGNFVLLSTQHTHLLLPQQQVGNALYLSADINWLPIKDANKVGEVGIRQLNGMPTDVYQDRIVYQEHVFYQDKADNTTSTNGLFIALSERLKPISMGIEKRFIAVPLSDSKQTNEPLFWCWHSVKILTEISFVTHPLPQSIMAKDAPINAYIVYNNDIIYPCDSTKLIDYALSR